MRHYAGRAATKPAALFTIEDSCVLAVAGAVGSLRTRFGDPLDHAIGSQHPIHDLVDLDHCCPAMLGSPSGTRQRHCWSFPARGIDVDTSSKLRRAFSEGGGLGRY